MAILLFAVLVRMREQAWPCSNGNVGLRDQLQLVQNVNKREDADWRMNNREFYVIFHVSRPNFSEYKSRLKVAVLYFYETEIYSSLCLK